MSTIHRCMDDDDDEVATAPPRDAPVSTSANPSASCREATVAALIDALDARRSQQDVIDRWLAQEQPAWKLENDRARHEP